MTLPRLLVRYSLFTLFIFFSATAVAKYTLPDELVALEPTRDQKIASVNIVQLLRRNHYGKVPLNNATSEKFLERYLEDIDRSRSYFMASDIAEFQKYKHRLDSALKTGDLEPAFVIYNRYQLRAEQRLRYMLALLDQGLDKLDFNKKEFLEIDRSKAPWISTEAQMNDLWRRRLKDSVLRMRINKKPGAEITKLLRKRYENQLRRLSQIRSEDVFQIYINSFTQIYDPHTQYFSPRRAENFDINMSLSLEGIGAVLQADEEYTKVVRLVPGGPAFKAGQLKPGDRIVGVAQGDINKKNQDKFTDIVGWRLDEVVDRIRGPKGSIVSLEVMPANNDGATRIYKITRDKVKLEEQSAQKSLIEYERNGEKYKIGVIEIPAFYIDFRAAQAGDPDYKSTTRDVRKLLAELKKENIDGLVIDLRNNGGGSLQEANELVGLFIPPGGPTVQVRDNRGRVNIQEDPDPAMVYSGPMTVLVNRLSASASEIFAGAMQDYGRALVVGGQTFGKGTVQTIQPLNHGQLKLTLAKFYRISGDSTQNHGVHPDIDYPSLFNNKEIGESALPSAMPWDQIKPADFNPFGTTHPYISQLEQRHLQRTEKNPYFIYLNKEKHYLDKLMARTEVSLNTKARKQEQEQMQDEQLNIENDLRKATKKPLLSSLDELEKEQEEKFANPELHDNPKEDALLVETGEILLDYLQLKQGALAANTPATPTLAP